MAYSKLKPDRSVTGLLPAFFTLIVFAVAGVMFGRNGVAWTGTVIFMMFAVFAYLAFWRTMATGYLASAVFLTLVALAMASIPGSLFGMRDRSLYRLFEVLKFPCIAWMIYLVLKRKAKWRGRDVLELAAAPVDNLGNGFTERPMPAGRVDFSKREILEFADFCRRNLIALPYLEKDRVFLVLIRMGREFGHLWNPGRDISADTWVCFDFEGNMSVNISRADYFEYREDLAFDRLCESLGDLFVEFIGLYRGRSAVRIIDRLNEMKVGFLS